MKPCPFCGAEPHSLRIVVDGDKTCWKCLSCGARGPEFVDDHIYGVAIDPPADRSKKKIMMNAVKARKLWDTRSPA